MFNRQRSKIQCQTPFVSNNREEDRRKIIDPVHGIIYFDKLIWDFIDTPHFQRLRKLKQFGTLDYVFPCATHTRYDHSIGTAHLASIFIEKLVQNNPEKYYNQDVASAIKTVILAGLLHDIGHGPFCNVFNTQIVTQIKRPNGTYTKWNHMIACDLLIESIHKLPHLHQHLTFQQKQRVKALVKGIPIGPRKWQFQIINNKKYGLDVHIFDFLHRDAHFLQAKDIRINHQELMIEARIIGDQICYPTKIAENVFNIYRSRYKLFKNYHFNIINKGIELMIIDILKLIKDKFRFQEACTNLLKNPSNYAEFMGLTDNILIQVEDAYNIMLDEKVKDEKNIENFKKAVMLLERLKNRDVYTFVKEFKYYNIDKIDVQVAHMFEKGLKRQKIIQEISQQIASIHPESIRIAIDDAGYALKQFNPMKKVKFFRKQNFSYKIIEQVQAQKLSIFRTSAYNQHSIKIYIKTSNYMLFLRVDLALSELLQKLNRKCEYQIKKETGMFYLFQGSSGKKPNNDKKPLSIAQQFLFTQETDQKQIEQEPKVMRNVSSPIFELMYFDQMIWDFIDTPQFQRLHKIKQLGCMYYVFPSCTYTVFQHSLGNAFLAKKMLAKLIEHHPQLYPQDEIATAIKTVTLAGLLKKIGQGPYNGIFDKQLTNQEKIKEKWCQYASIVIFDGMMKQTKLKRHLCDDQIQRVKDLIKGAYPVGSKRIWQFQLINNTKNGIDVALFQQLRSDPYQLQAKTIYIDHDLLFEQARIIDQEISYPAIYVDKVLSIFQSRYRLQKDYYNDPTVKSIQLMLVDVIKLVKEKLNLKEEFWILLKNNDNSLDQYITDDIFERIEETYHFMLQYEPQDKNIHNFQKAIKLIKRIVERKYYIFVRELKYEVRQRQYQLDQIPFHSSLTPSQIKKKIFEYLDNKNIDFQVDISDASFGLQAENPTRKVSFFRQENSDLKKQYKKVAQYQLQELSMLLTDAFTEKSIKVFLKEDKPGYFDHLSLAIEQISKQYDSDSIFLGQIGINPSSDNGLRTQSMQRASEASVYLQQ